jgi:hypothetical protein
MDESIKVGDIAVFKAGYWLKIADKEISPSRGLVLGIEQLENFNIILLLDEEGVVIESYEDYLEKVC